MKLSIIVAVSENGVIGKDNKLPWHLPADLKFFKNTTMGHCIIMGRKTYDSIGKPLPGRTSIIVTRNKDYKPANANFINPECWVVNSLEEAVNAAKAMSESEAFIIGGAEIINESIGLADKIYLTEIKKDFEGDVFLKSIDRSFWNEVKRVENCADEKNPYNYDFVELEANGTVWV